MLQLSQQFPEVFEHSGLSHGQKGKRMEVVLAYAKKIIFWTRKRKNSPGYQMRGKPVLPKLRYVCYLMSHHYQWRLLFNDVATHRYRSHRGLAKFSGHQSRSTSNRGRGFFEKLCPGHAVPSRFVPRFRVSWSPVSGGCRKEWWRRNWKVYKDDPARTLQDMEVWVLTRHFKYYVTTSMTNVNAIYSYYKSVSGSNSNFDLYIWLSTALFIDHLDQDSFQSIIEFS